MVSDQAEVKVREKGIAQGAVLKIERQVQVVGSVEMVQVELIIQALQGPGEGIEMIMGILGGHILALGLAEQGDDEEKGRRDKPDDSGYLR